AQRKQENQNLQRPAAYRPGERRASFSPPPLRRPWEAKPPLRDAAAHSPQKKTLAEAFCFLTPGGDLHETDHRRQSWLSELPAVVSDVGARAPAHKPRPHWWRPRC